MKESECPKCGGLECYREEADVGVGMVYGPYGCPECGWSDDDEYDFSEGKSHLDEKGNLLDQWGGCWPSESIMARAYRNSEQGRYLCLKGDNIK